MKNLNLLLGLALLLLMGCEPPTKNLPGVYPLKKKIGSPNTYVTTLTKADILADINQGRVPSVSVDRVEYESVRLCSKLIQEKNDCLAAANGDWSVTGIGEPRNGLGNVECCNRYYDKKISECIGIMPKVIDVEDVLDFQSFLTDGDNRVIFPLELKVKNEGVTRPEIAIISLDSDPYLVVTYQEKINDEFVNRGYLQNMNHIGSTPLPLNNATFVKKGVPVSSDLVVIENDAQLVQRYTIPLPGGNIPTAIKGCGTQGTDRPIGGRSTGGNVTNLAPVDGILDSCNGPCNGICIAKNTQTKELEMYIHLVVPKGKKGLYHGQEVILQQCFTSKSSFQSFGLTSQNLYDNNDNSVFDWSGHPRVSRSPYPTLSRFPGNVPMVIDSSEFKPYLMDDHDDCTETVEFYALQIAIPFDLTLTSSFVGDSQSVLILAAQIIDAGSESSPRLFQVSTQDIHSNIPGSRIILENETLLAFSGDNDGKFLISNGLPRLSENLFNNVYLCPN